MRWAQRLPGQCRGCGEVKPPEAYYKSQQAQCKDCYDEKMKKHYRENKDAYIARANKQSQSEGHKEKKRFYNMATSYGINEAAYRKMVEEQDGKCLICCRREIRLVPDHDHGTGKVRGLLCFKCNSMIGMANDNPTILSRAIEYLKGSVS